jgi:hypothetical protein
MFSLMLCSVPTPGTEQLGFYPIQIEEKRKIIFFIFSQVFIFYFRSAISASDYLMNPYFATNIPI